MNPIKLWLMDRASRLAAPGWADPELAIPGRPHRYARLINAEGEVVHTTRDCPADALAVLRDGLVYTRTNDFEDIGGTIFRIYREGHRTWRAAGALEA